MTTRFRPKIGHVMILVAILSILFGLFGVAGGIGVGAALALVLAPIALTPAARRWEALSWVAAALPTLLNLALLATWLTAWGYLGHRPRVNLDDPKFISPIVDVPFAMTFALMMLWPASALACPALATLRAIGRVDAGSRPPLRVAKAILLPALWSAGLWLLPLPDDIGVWYLD